jgi:hypothetical protein
MNPRSVRRPALAAAFLLAAARLSLAGDLPALAIRHEVLVTTDPAPDSCDRATESLLTVAEDTVVRFCFRVRNIGEGTLRVHDLVTDTWGKLDSMLPLNLAPGQTAMRSKLVVVTDDQTTTGTWIARDVAPAYAPSPTSYDFTDISATGTRLNVAWIEAQTVTMPFPLRFYGKSSPYISVCNLGVIELDSSRGFCHQLPEALPSQWELYAMMPFWARLDWFLGGVYTQTVGIEPHRRQIVQWQRGLEKFAGSGAGDGNGVTFQAVISEDDDRIVFQYPDVSFGIPGTDDGQAAVIGMNYDGNLAQMYSFFTPVLQAGQAILWTPNVWRTTQASNSATVIVHSAKIEVGERAIAATLAPGRVVQRRIPIANAGLLPLDWHTGEAQAGSTAHIPKADRPFEAKHVPDSLDAPAWLHIGRPPAAQTAPLPRVGGASLPAAYGREMMEGEFVKVDLATGLLTFIARAQDAPVSGVDFRDGDFSRLYSLSGGLGSQGLIYVDPATGARSDVGPAEPGWRQAWSDLSFDSSNGALYAASVDFFVDDDGRAFCGPNSTLWRVNADVGTPRRIGTIRSDGCVMGLATNANGEMFGVDTQNDTLLAIDKTTGAGTVVGPLGFNAQGQQGLDFDEKSNVLYLATLNLDSQQSELRSVDTLTGATTWLATVNDGNGGFVDLISLALESGGGGCVRPADAPWLSLTPAQGQLAPSESQAASLRLDATGLAPGRYEALLCLFSNDPRNRFVTLPVSIDVSADWIFADGFD